MIDGMAGQRDYEERRARLDALLGVSTWHVPGGRPRPRVPARVAGAPAWWHGDEEASQSFLRAMGVT